jgi:Zinc-finger associated domain (zf-AD)
MHADDKFLMTCRCCLSNKGQFKDMTTEVLALNFKSDLSLIDVFKQCTGVEFDDVLTTRICLSCEFKLQMCYEFKEMCQASDLVLKQELKDEQVFDAAMNDRTRMGGVVAKKSRTTVSKIVQNDKSKKRVQAESNLKLVRKNGAVADQQNNFRKRIIASPFDFVPTSTGSDSQPKSDS